VNKNKQINWEKNMLVSKSYGDQCRAMHKNHQNWGAEGERFVPLVQLMMEKHDCKTVLDYGCGKGTFTRKLGFGTNYDPNMPEHDALPEAHDLVLCNDVMEHIEPELLDNVLSHLRDVTKKVAIIGIATKYSVLYNLPDGRNAHLIVENADWWNKKLNDYFSLKEISKNKKEVVFEATPK